ncbi:MAG: DUF2095 domain-containing protein [Thermoprotei archaeon]|nr:MAG: DUF2095 domain-containing protein [Thermoprotei archaeon]
MDMDYKKFKKLFPHLAEEISRKEMCISISGVRWHEEEEEDELRNPGVISFIRRCRTEKEALEVIEWMEKRGEISKEYADDLRKQLKTRGLRSFGPFKEDGYYFKKYYFKQRRRLE